MFQLVVHTVDVACAVDRALVNVVDRLVFLPVSLLVVLDIETSVVQYVLTVPAPLQLPPLLVTVIVCLDEVQVVVQELG